MERVLELIKEKPSVSRAAIARELNITETQVRTAISKLKDRGQFIGAVSIAVVNGL